MNECRVCIVDSGIANIEDDGFIGGIDLVERGKSDFLDYNGHGSMCLSTVKKFVPVCEYYVVKVFGEQLKCSTFQLMEALSYLRGNDARIINLSLSTTDSEYREEIENLCRQLFKQGKIIIASCDNRNNISIPAQCRYVLGVKGVIADSIEKYCFNHRRRLECIADSNPILVKGKDEKYSFFGGNSKAAACMTGIILRLWQKHENEDNCQIINRLRIGSDVNIWNIGKGKKEESAVRSNFFNADKVEMEVLYRTVEEVLNIKSEEKKIHMNTPLIEFGLNCENAMLLLHSVEKEFKLDLCYDTISLRDVNSIDGLGGLIAKGRQTHE